jgi:hypothetical protein
MARMLYELLLTACDESEKNIARAERKTARQYRVHVTSSTGEDGVQKRIASNLERRFLFLLRVESVKTLRKASSREQELHLELETVT